MSLAALVEEIEAGPKGPEIGAFFDLDGTLVTGYTINAYYADRLRHPDFDPSAAARGVTAALEKGLLGVLDPANLGTIGAAALRGRREDEIRELAERLFAQRIASTIRPEARDLVAAHRRMGHTVAIASSATAYQVAPVARDLGIEHLLCTRLGAENGVLTGTVEGQMLWGQPKAQAVRDFARREGIDRSRSHAYANGAEDIPFLSTVGRPHPVNPHPTLRRAAEAQNWPILQLRDRPRAGLREILGTIAGAAGFTVGAGLGLAVGAMYCDPRLGANTSSQLACDAALALTGVRLRVTGEEHVWVARPAVFVANHQSAIDPIVVGAILRRDVTGVAKKQLRRNPAFLVAGLATHMTYIDRANPEEARRDVNRLADRLREGISVVIFPEGTRSPTPVLAPFKKGAFHLAMQARVPVVPIVLRNTGELLWRGSVFVHAGTVDVAVGAPIPTDRWTAETISDHAAEVRQRFVETLDRWPE